MNAVQMFYAREVLGVKLLVQPPPVRELYRLHTPPSSTPEVLFFCTDMNQTGPCPDSQKDLINKMSAALDDREGSSPACPVVEILKPETKTLPAVFHSLLTRYSPQKGVVVFDSHLALKLLNQTNPLIFETTKTTPFRFRGPQSSPVLLCVLKPLSRFFSPSKEEVQKIKQEAWVKLRGTFFPKNP